jgi:hypothetical protein
MLKIYIMNLHPYFYRVRYLITKFVIEIQTFIKLMMKISYNVFDIDYDVHYHPAKSQLNSTCV